MNNIFFQINSEKKFGYKKLSDADLGLSEKSHQTHIGLFSNVLTFLPDWHMEKCAILIYKNYCEILPCYYGKIIRSNGNIDAPNIKSGVNNEEVTIVKKIREYAATNSGEEWFLVWFGTDSEELVFWLISSNSEDYKFINSELSSYKVYDFSDKILKYLETKLNLVSNNIQKDLEIASQIGDIEKKFKKLDLERAAKKCQEIGRKGEELIADFLDVQKSTGFIQNYVWENKSREVGKPYDFIINYNTDSKQFIDVKSTSFGFSQNIIFSENEISFINELNNDKAYSAYRVFDINEENKKLIICNNCLGYLREINRKINDFHKDLAENNAYTKSVNIAVNPEICFSKRTPLIKL